MAVQDYYYAFISYSRKDEEQAKNLHRQFEHYHLPTHLEDETLPKEFSPIFRDEDELSSGALDEEIARALKNSNWLVVLCSPASAKSNYVNLELKQFIESYKEREETRENRIRHIIPIIISGVPYSGIADTECFPPALRSLRKEGKELRAPNVTSSLDGLERAFICAIATMVNLPFDTLWNRRQREIEEERNRLLEVNRRIQLNQARAVTAKAKEHILNGNSPLAILLALEVLPFKNNDRVYCAEAESALREAVVNPWISYEAQYGEVQKAFWASNEKGVVVIYSSGTIVLFDSDNGAALHRKSIHVNVKDCVYCEVTNVFSLVSDDCILRFYDANNLTCIREIKLDVEPYEIGKLAISPSGNFIGLSLGAKGFLIYDIKSSAKSLFSIANDSMAICFISENRIALSKSQNIIICDLESRDIIRAIPAHDEIIYSIDCSNSGTKLSTASFDGKIKIWDTSNFELEKVFASSNSPVHFATFNTSEEFIVSGSRCGDVALWKIDNERDEPVFYYHAHNRTICSCYVSHDFQSFLSASIDGKIVRPRFYSGIKQIQPSNKIIAAVLMDWENDDLFVGSRDSNIYHLDSDFRILGTFEGHLSEIESMVPLYKGSRLFSSSYDYTLKLWDVKSHKLIRSFQLKDEVTAQMVKIDETTLVCISKMNRLLLISASSDSIEVEVILESPDTMTCLDYNATIKQIAVGFENGQVSLITLDKCATNLRDGNNLAIKCLRFSKRGDILAIATENKTIDLLRLKRREQDVTLSGHSSYIKYLSFDKSNKYIISSGWDGCVKVWDIETGILISNFVDRFNLHYQFSEMAQDQSYIISANENTLTKINFHSLDEITIQAEKSLKGRTLSLQERRDNFLE